MRGVISPAFKLETEGVFENTILVNKQGFLITGKDHLEVENHYNFGSF